MPTSRRLVYACFDHAGVDAQRYGYAAATGRAERCEDEIVEQLVELQRRAADYAARDGRLPEDAFFNAQQNASLVADAERYYRSMFRGRDESWNLRDTHMADTLDALVAHLSQRGTPRRWSYGLITPTSGTPAPRRWASATGS